MGTLDECKAKCTIVKTDHNKCIWLSRLPHKLTKSVTVHDKLSENKNKLSKNGTRLVEGIRQCSSHVIAASPWVVRMCRLGIQRGSKGSKSRFSSFCLLHLTLSYYVQNCHNWSLTDRVFLVSLHFLLFQLVPTCTASVWSTARTTHYICILLISWYDLSIIAPALVAPHSVIASLPTCPASLQKLSVGRQESCWQT